MQAAYAVAWPSVERRIDWLTMPLRLLPLDTSLEQEVKELEKQQPQFMWRLPSSCPAVLVFATGDVYLQVGGGAP